MVYSHKKYLEYQNKYYYQHKEERKSYRVEYSRNFNKRVKLQVAEHYGSKCACCGELDINFLTIHHINGRHDRIKKVDKYTGIHLWRWLIRNNYPEEYQLLCYKCNCSIKNHKKPFCPVHHPELYNDDITKGLTEHYLRFQRLNFQKRRQIIISHYGNKCKCCGETIYEFLTIDHIIHSQNIGKGLYGERLYRYLIKHDFPEGFQILCWNCNSIKSNLDNELCYIHHPELYKSKPNQII